MAIKETWTQSYLRYLINRELPDSPTDARRISRRSKAFTIINGELYKRNISGVLERCVTIGDGKAILQDIHEGICGHHAGSRSLVAKALRAGFYWPTAMSNAKQIVRRCTRCQRFADKPNAPGSELLPIPIAWPFAQWGLDMIGKLPKSSNGGHVFLLVAVDKFTKWIEAMPVTNQKGTTAVKFFESIVYRFGVPHSIITDNGSNFISEEFQDFCEGPGINIMYASVAHPQTNGQVEKANSLIGAGIKKRLMSSLEQKAVNWTKELPSVLWSLRTTPNSATGYTPFFMVHGAEAVLPAEVCHQAPWVVAYTEAESTTALEDAVDTLDEARDIAAARSAVYQQSLRNYHSRRLRPRSFVEGDLVLRLKQERTKNLESPWEGPYIVTEFILGGAYRLKHREPGVAYSNPWNVAQLRRFYPYLPPPPFPIRLLTRTIYLPLQI